ncbi:UvrD-helicase domain-containing protein [Mariluticola halotolerans]|uniref:UvrD-helicase domain-containing protein n=1 Tax=Mariluticola halotolerans TaxID=2909283 RepID=UPI0026E41567|nr:UvrD-helicase domain-containing protein [Mariluticola halotolerans]UJQ95553.1 UvrD-helicase domain-containing protein [Mariluticola halotolerans]
MTHDGFLAATKPIDHDKSVDDGIRSCLQLASGKSFITFAGAGSGKTYSLEKALDYLKGQYAADFSKLGKQVAVVTFTNNAANEIIDRVARDPIFAISTIHSFCWLSIAGFNEDIRKWYLATIPDEISDLEGKEHRGRAGAASEARKRNIARLTDKMEWLVQPRSFIYDPNGVNSAQNALSHSDVLKIFAHFLTTKPMMGEILANKYPFIFVDESQDTDRSVINSLFDLQKKQANTTVIGLFGDTMQRIFFGGEPQLGISLPENWTEFDKHLNHRSGRRIVGLGNTIRNDDDCRIQYAKDGAEDGLVRFFLIPHGIQNKDEIEQSIREKMAELDCDPAWNSPRTDETAVLLLEHKMASRRLGFEHLIEALSISVRIKDHIFDGDSSDLNYFSNIILPLVEAGEAKDEFQVMTILRSNSSPLLEESTFSEGVGDPLLAARTAERAFRSKMLKNNVTFQEVLEVIAEHNLLPIPTKLRSFVSSQEDVDPGTGPKFDFSALEADTTISSDATQKDDEIDAWAAALKTPFQQVRGYRDYVNDNSIYRTHQGVKGNEFERVMVIMDDEEAGGFLFSYEQYFGAKDPSPSTIAKIKAGEETGLDRTRRLFYVTSTRAKSSLAHVIYSADVDKVRQNLLTRKLAKKEEILVFPFAKISDKEPT